MGNRLNGAVARQLRVLFDTGRIGALSDAQLLEQFTTGPPESGELAFAALVERHGPAVYRICRAVVGDEHEAQDAFQATFLILASKARRLCVRDSLGPWLRKVAQRVAQRARRSVSRRLRHERRYAEQVAARDQDRPIGADPDVTETVRNEIDRLSDRDRAVVVLCDLQGCSHELASQTLGWPVGTVKSRLSRARARLKRRLARRGLAPSVLPWIVSSSRLVPSSSLPVGLAESTARLAANPLTIGGLSGAVPATVAALCEGASRMVLWNTLKVGVAGLVTAGAVATGLTGVTMFEAGEKGDRAPASAPHMLVPGVEASEVPLDEIDREIARLDLELMAEEVEQLRNHLADTLRAENETERRGVGVEAARSASAHARAAYLDAARTLRRERRELETTGAEAGPATDSNNVSPEAPEPGNPDRLPAYVIGSVDVEAVFERSDLVRQSRNALQVAAQVRTAELNPMVEQIAELTRELDDLRFDPGDPEHARLWERIAKLKAKLEVNRELAQREFAQREVEVIAKLYQDLEAVIAEIAEARGLAYVLRKDTGSISPTNVTEIHSMGKRSVLYANPATDIDITEEVIQELNRRTRTVTAGDPASE